MKRIGLSRIGAAITTITSFSNTYYPGQQALVSAGSTSVVIGAATYVSTPISIGDVLLMIQMQGAQINSTNGSVYGDGVSGSGYLVNGQLLAGNMESVKVIKNPSSGRWDSVEAGRSSSLFQVVKRDAS